VQSGQFRQDLFYRLNVIGLRTPALRDRLEDLPELAHALLARLCAEAGQAVPELSGEALQWLQSHELPGNVRELENLLQRALALSSGTVLRPQDFGEGGDTLPDTLRDPLPDTGHGLAPADTGSPLPPDLQSYLDDQERRVLVQALQECDYNRTAAAARLGLNLRQMRYRIQRLGIVLPGAAGAADSDLPDA
jgi:two-component system response regulator PilR (NtrC family)